MHRFLNLFEARERSLQRRRRIERERGEEGKRAKKRVRERERKRVRAGALARCGVVFSEFARLKIYLMCAECQAARASRARRGGGGGAPFEYLDKFPFCPHIFFLIFRSIATVISSLAELFAGFKTNYYPRDEMPRLI